MRIAVFGLGYVGVVSATCLARDGHFVIGVDTNQEKVDFVNSGTSPIIEKDLGPLLAGVVSSGHLRATGDAVEAVSEADISMSAQDYSAQRDQYLLRRKATRGRPPEDGTGP